MQFAILEWKKGESKNDLPYAPAFGDIYFSTENGWQESEHVFVQGNALESRFPQAFQNFTIIETGFGTGLNFFVVAEKWRQLAPKNAHLTFVSVEKYPLSFPDMQRACLCWPEFSAIQQQLLPFYAHTKPGLNQWKISDAVTLQLWIADVLDTLPAVTTTADAWLLDGFAPAKNPDMWNEQLFTQIARLSKPGISTFATFTSAGHVRRSLQAAGFEVAKRPGFGKKREMLCGKLRSGA